MKNTLRTLIVDDEHLARERVRLLLKSESDIEIIDECEDGESAVELIRKKQPDLVFLDVQMPEKNGFEVLAALDPQSLPAIIFVTAHDQFALKAFEVHALDYLLKPLDSERFAAAVQRARDWIGQRQPGGLDARLSALLAELPAAAAPPPPTPERLAVKSEGRVILLKIMEIDWVEAADNYVNLHVGDDSHLLRETMTGLEKRLPSDKFLRISRSTMVNLDRIRELQPLFHGEYTVILTDETRLTLSRGYRDKLNQLLGKDR